MHKTNLSWRYAVSMVATLAVAASTVATATAAVPRAHGSAQAHSSHSFSKTAAACKRNKATGTIKYSDWQFPDSLNPYQTNASVSFETIYAFLDGLTQYDNNAKVVPVIAKALPTAKNGGIQNGGKTFAMTIKPGLQWSNGQTITANDVKFGWKLAMDKRSGPYCAGTCDVISRIDVKGKYGLVFHLKQLYAPFIPSGLPPVWPSKWPGAWANNDVNAAVAKLWQDPTFNFEGPSFPTNGPYQVVSFNKDDRINLAPMKYYHTLTCGGKVKSLIFAFYSSKPTLIAAAANHDTDTTTNYTLADIPALQAHASAYHLNNNPGFLIEHLTFNVDATYNGKPNPLHNIKVRQALALSLDKYGVLQSALAMNRTQASKIIAWTPLILTKALKQPFADKQLIGQWDPITKKYTVDTGKGKALADAKTLLKQAGYPNGFSLDGFTTSGNPVRAAQFGVITKSFSNVGVTFTPNFIPASKLFGEWADGGVLQHGAFQVAMYADVGYPDPDAFKFNFQHQYVDREKTDVHSAINANVAGIHDASFDKAFNKASATLKGSERQKWYNVWQVGLNQKAYWVPLFYRGEINTDDGRIGNFKSNPTNAGNQWNVFAWYPKGSS